MDEAYGILEYNKENLFNYISYKTKTSYTDISKKKQITYLTNYLEYHKGSSNVFFIYESEYMDQHYLEDYSSYYSKCFYPYDKTCARIHFFKTKDTIDSQELNLELEKALNNEATIIKNTHYLGFVVVRPIPNTFLAKVCIKPSKNNNYSKKIISKTYNVSLFGIPFSVSTVAFQEQEKILSACATTALWSFYHAHPGMHFDNLPSGYMITKSAYSKDGGHDNEFPNKGLSTDMMCRSIKKYGLFPKILDVSGDCSKHLREYLYAYNTHEIPAIYGVRVQEEKNELHAVTVLGYTLEDSRDNRLNSKNISLCANNIKHMHVHDDRNGAFLRIDLNNNTIKINGESNIETYMPNTLILGIDKSIRINYAKIKEFCERFSMIIATTLGLGFIDWKIKKGDFEKLIWDIKLKKVNDLKSNIISSNISNKMTYLTKSWPKYIWSATIKNINNESYIELLFDATNIEQGKIFLGILYYGNSINTIGHVIETYFDKFYRFNEKEYLFDEVKEFTQKRDSYSEMLNKDFGTLCMPEEIKETELVDEEVLETPLLIISNSLSNQKNMDDLYNDGYDLLWLIDTNGCLIIGSEKKGSDQGHPTLTGGNPARIAGEIKKSGGEWIVNPFSRRYSKEYTREDKIKYIDNVIVYKLIPTFPNDIFVRGEFD